MANITGPSIFVLYSRNFVITVNIYVLAFEPRNGINFVRYRRVFGITVIVITKFDCSSHLLLSVQQLFK